MLKTPNTATVVSGHRQPIIYLLILLLALFSPPGNAAIPEIETTLPARVTKALKRFKLDGAGLSILVQKIGADSPLLEFNSDRPRNPASAIKLLTTLVALETLTPAYTWHTDIFSDGEIDGKILYGNLFLRGGGDPYMPIERLWLLVRQLRRKGLETIAGDLIIDQGLFAPIDEDPATFDGRPLRAYNVVPAALISNFNVTRLTFTPEPVTGRVLVALDPALQNLTVKNKLTLVDKPCRGYQRGIALTSKSNGFLQMEGRFPNRCASYTMDRSVVDKNTFTAELFRQLWLQSGGQWHGVGRSGETDDDMPLMMRFYSLSLAEVTRSINKYSNNLMARMMFLTLGVEADQLPGTKEKSIEVIRSWLDEKKISMPELTIVNGAGSSRDTRISAASLGELLLAGWRSQYMPEFIGSMSLSGQDGTFRRRHRSGPLYGKIHAKTGRLDHVVSLAGYYQSRRGDRYIVVLLHNATDVHRGAGHAVQDAVLLWLANTVG